MIQTQKFEFKSKTNQNALGLSISAEKAAIAESSARRRADMEASASSKAAAAARDESVRRDAELKVAAWAAGRSLPALLADLPAVFPAAPSLEVAADAAGAELKKAYMKAARALHPDKTAGLDHDSAMLAHAVFTAIAALWEAHESR